MLDSREKNLTAEQKQLIEYHAYVQSSIIAKWVEDGMTVPPDRLAKILMAFLPDILKEFIETDAP